MNCRLRVRMIVSTVALAMVAVAFTVGLPNAEASWTDSWAVEMALGEPASQAVVVNSPNGTVYIMGGVTDASYTAVPDSYSYDPDTGEWTVLAPMPGAVRGAAGVMGLDGRVYVFGGISSYTQIYDPETDAWVLGAAMDHAVWEAKAAVVSSGLIWVVGGEDALPGQAQIYDPVADSWSTGSSAPAAVECGAMIADGDNLYYSGGDLGDYMGTSGFFMYDAALDTWTALADLPEPRTAHAMVMGADGLIYLVGGSDQSWNTGGSAIYDSVVVYDPTTDEWSSAPDMNYPRTYLGATVTPDGRILALGGNTDTTVLDDVESLQLYEFEYSIELSSSSVRAGEAVLLTFDAQFTYIDEYYSDAYWYLVSDADGTVYIPDGMWIPTDAVTAVSIDVPVLIPPGDYTFVVDYWVIYADNAYEIVEMQEFPLEVLPAPEPADVLIAALEVQIAALETDVADLQTQLAVVQGDLGAISTDIAALETQLVRTADRSQYAELGPRGPRNGRRGRRRGARGGHSRAADAADRAADFAHEPPDLDRRGQRGRDGCPGLGGRQDEPRDGLRDPRPVGRRDRAARHDDGHGPQGGSSATVELGAGSEQERR